ncbi:MAG: hypothetical protein ACJA1X_001840, partial [Bermanella sp.]
VSKVGGVTSYSVLVTTAEMALFRNITFILILAFISISTW